jgi:hypothetical protein
MYAACGATARRPQFKPLRPRATFTDAPCNEIDHGLASVACVVRMGTQRTEQPEWRAGKRVFTATSMTRWGRVRKRVSPSVPTSSPMSAGLRRSARLQITTPAPVGADTGSDIEDHETASSGPRKRARKSQVSGEQTPAKVARGKKGKLENMARMPLEVLFEVCLLSGSYSNAF